MDHDAFVAAIDDFLSETGISPTRFSKEATGDPNFFRFIKLTGRQTREGRVKRVLAYMRAERRKLGKRAA